MNVYLFLLHLIQWLFFLLVIIIIYDFLICISVLLKLLNNFMDALVDVDFIILILLLNIKLLF